MVESPDEGEAHEHPEENIEASEGISLRIWMISVEVGYARYELDDLLYLDFAVFARLYGLQVYRTVLFDVFTQLHASHIRVLNRGSFGFAISSTSRGGCDCGSRQGPRTGARPSALRRSVLAVGRLCVRRQVWRCGHACTCGSRHSRRRVYQDFGIVRNYWRAALVPSDYCSVHVEDVVLIQRCLGEEDRFQNASLANAHVKELG